MKRIDALSKELNFKEKLTTNFSQSLSTDIASVSNVFGSQSHSDLQARSYGKFTTQTYSQLLEKYSRIPNATSANLPETFQEMITELLGGIPLWKSPNLHYNVGAPVNSFSSAMYSAAVEQNVFNINDGLSGNAIIAEHAVVKILSELAGLTHNTPSGFFTFGGTATIIYAVKASLAKVFPLLHTTGITEKIKVVITEDSHFSHLRVLDWLNIGTKKTLILKANSDRTSCVKSAEQQLRKTLQEGYKVPLIILNGGTTYDHAIDDLLAFRSLRDALVEEFKLSYKPHIHVDSVIGWAWLTFKDYDYKINALGIERSTLEIIEIQNKKIRSLCSADSWGVDFHKAVGSCPVPTSVIIFNHSDDVLGLSSKSALRDDPLARDLSKFTPSDFTLETSRPAAAPLAALGAFHSQGLLGFQLHLATLVQMSQLFRELIKTLNRKDIEILNYENLGFVTMLRLLPNVDFEVNNNHLNSYMKNLVSFSNINLKEESIIEFSYTSKYFIDSNGEAIGAIKFYPTSPFLNSEHIQNAVSLLVKYKDNFDSLS